MSQYCMQAACYVNLNKFNFCRASPVPVTDVPVPVRLVGGWGGGTRYDVPRIVKKRSACVGRACRETEYTHRPSVQDMNGE